MTAAEFCMAAARPDNSPLYQHLRKPTRRQHGVEAIGRRWLIYGWIVVAGAFLSLAINVGLIHSRTMFLVVFPAEFGWSRADASMAYSISQFVSGASARLTGILSTV